jgi:hypothetical protein
LPAPDDDAEKSRHGASSDLHARDFAASGPNRKRLYDIIYMPTDEGFPHFAGVMVA